MRGADIDRLADAVYETDGMLSPALVRDEAADAVVTIFNLKAATLEEATERGIALLRAALEAAEAGGRELATLAVTS